LGIDLRLEADQPLLAEIEHRPLDHRRLLGHQGERFLLAQPFPVGVGQLPEGGAGAVEQHLPAQFLAPGLQNVLADAFALVVVEMILHAMTVEPGPRLLHGIAVLDAVDGDGLAHEPACPFRPVSRYAAPGSSASPSWSGWAMVACNASLSSSPSDRLITTQATPLPMVLVSARHSLMNLSMPTRMAIDWIGISGTIESVAASVMKPAPVTPDAPFEVMMATPRIPSSCQIVRWVLVACARNSVASVM